MSPCARATNSSAWIAAGEKPKADWRIGTEHEKFVFHTDTLGARSLRGPARHPRADGSADRPLRLGADHRRRQHHRAEAARTAKHRVGTISLEPGGQFELSGAPLADAARDRRRDAGASERGARRRRGSRHRLPRPRLLAEVDAGRDAAHAQAALRRDDALHAAGRHARPRHDVPHLHDAGEPRLRRTKPTWSRSCACRWRCSRSRRRCSPPRRSPRASPTASSRCAARSGATPTRDRTGMLPFVFETGMGYERYVDYALDVPMYFVYRDGHYIDVRGRVVPRFPGGKLPALPGEQPTLDDWSDHLTTLFPEVRLKSFLEMRGADGGRWQRICALPAFWVGLLYDRGCARCGLGSGQGLDRRRARGAAQCRAADRRWTPPSERRRRGTSPARRCGSRAAASIAGGAHQSLQPGRDHLSRCRSTIWWQVGAPSRTSCSSATPEPGAAISTMCSLNTRFKRQTRRPRCAPSFRAQGGVCCSADRQRRR